MIEINPQATLISIVAGLLASVLAEWAKRHPAIPISPEKPGVLQIYLAGIAAMFQLGYAYFSGGIEGLSLKDPITTIMLAIFTYASSIGAYHGGVKHVANKIAAPSPTAQAVPAEPGKS